MESENNKFTDFLQSQYKAVQEKVNSESSSESLERYTQKKLIGEGAQKQIFEVYDAHCSRELAMAVLKDASPEAQAQFQREARITALLQHPNIMPIYDTGINELGQDYFTMKLGRGDTMQDLMTQLRGNSLQDRLALFLKVCDALIYAHSKGVLHRDLKPENIYIGQFGELLLCDWGLANIVFENCDEIILDDEELQNLNLKVSLKGSIKGTPGFIAPEIFKEAYYSFQSDVYALGAIFYILLTGDERALQFDDHSKKELFSEQDKSLSSSLKAICTKALAETKTERYTSVNEMRLDIKSYINGFAPKAEEASIWVQLKLLHQRNKRVLNLSALFLSVVLFLTLGFIDSLKTKEEQASRLVTQLKESDAKRKQAEKELTPHYLAKAKKAFLNGQPETAFTLAQVCYNFDQQNEDVRDLYGKALMSMQEFAQAAEILEGINPELAGKALRCLKIEQSSFSKLDQIIAFLRIVGVEPDNDKAYIYRNILYDKFSKFEPEDKLKLLRNVLMMRNKLSSMNAVLEYEDEAYIIDLSNNPKLKILNVLAKFGPAVIKEFNLSHTKINSFYEIENFSIINLKLRYAGKLPLQKFNHYYESLDAEGSKNDFAPYLNNKPVKYLNIHKTPFSNYGVLTTLKELQTLIVSKGKLPSGVREKLAKNCQIIEK